MAYTLEINIDEANTAANAMAATNSDLKAKLEEISGVINNMNDKWFSDTSAETVDKFNQVKNKQFGEYFDRVEGFVKFIRETVTTAFKKNEQSIRINKDNIQNERAQAR